MIMCTVTGFVIELFHLMNRRNTSSPVHNCECFESFSLAFYVEQMHVSGKQKVEI